MALVDAKTFIVKFRRVYTINEKLSKYRGGEVLSQHLKGETSKRM